MGPRRAPGGHSGRGTPEADGEPLPAPCLSHAPLRGQRAAEQDGEYREPGTGHGEYGRGSPVPRQGGMRSGLCDHGIHTPPLWASVSPGDCNKGFGALIFQSRPPVQNLVSEQPVSSPALPSLPLGDPSLPSPNSQTWLTLEALSLSQDPRTEILPLSVNCRSFPQPRLLAPPAPGVGLW